jgi:hypothetical protein
MFVNKPKYRTVVCTNKTIYLLLKIILSNQVEVNPGPSANTSSDSIKYPCYICNIPVLWSDKGVACDKCDQWYHTKCINMSSQVYHGLDMSTNWYCNKCETPNDISALYCLALSYYLHFACNLFVFSSLLAMMLRLDYQHFLYL